VERLYLDTNTGEREGVEDGTGGAEAEIAAGRARRGRGRPGDFKSRRRRVLLGRTEEVGRKEWERKGMMGAVRVSVREGGEKELGRPGLGGRGGGPTGWRWAGR
jgi:hypothetical protein